jgi:superfamily II DNA or RNA helicase
MIRIELLNKLYLRFSTDNLDYLRSLKEAFTEKVEGYFWSPKARAGLWHGDISLFDGRNKSLPFGLLDEVIEFHKFQYPDEELKISDNVKSLFKPPKINISFDLALKPYPYQEESIRKFLQYSKGIVRIATAGGKSLVVAYLLDNLRKNNLSQKALVIVPTIILLDQFYSDLIEYGIDEKLLGLIGDSHKDFDKPIIISTWQSLQIGKKIEKKRKELIKDRLKLFDTVIVDETHLAQSSELKLILSECINAQFRFGLTGTLHDARLDLLNTKSLLGPIIAEYSAAYLAERGYIAKCNILTLNMHYDEHYKGTYDEIKDQVFNDVFRLETIEYLIRNINENFLLLVGLVEKEGKILEEYLKARLPKKEIIFIYGKTSAEERQYWRKRMNTEKNIIIIATYKLFQLGVNIPSLKFLIFASPFKSKVRVLQSIGRALRQHVDKTHGAYIFDFCDQVKTLDRHAEIRARHYIKEEFDVKEYFLWADNCNEDLKRILKVIE